MPALARAAPMKTLMKAAIHPWIAAMSLVVLTAVQAIRNEEVQMTVKLM